MRLLIFLRGRVITSGAFSFGSFFSLTGDAPSFFGLLLKTVSFSFALLFFLFGFGGLLSVVLGGALGSLTFGFLI